MKKITPRKRSAKPQPAITLANPVSGDFLAHIALNSQSCTAVVEPGTGQGQHVVICGAGPSLADHAAEYCAGERQVWACNSALPYLVSRGLRVTHGFCIDQTLAMLREWASTPDVEYLVASSVHPNLTRLLLHRGRRLRWFHNYVGIDERPVAEGGKVRTFENWVYVRYYPPTMLAGSGLNSVTRAIDVAMVMGFETITVLGADCAIRSDAPNPDAPIGSKAHHDWITKHTIMHADGGNAVASGATPMIFSGEIDGRVWHTKPDMVISAQCLVKTAKHFAGRIRLIGDTLPNALMEKDEAFLARLPSFGGAPEIAPRKLARAEGRRRQSPRQSPRRS